MNQTTHRQQTNRLRTFSPYHGLFLLSLLAYLFLVAEALGQPYTGALINKAQTWTALPTFNNSGAPFAVGANAADTEVVDLRAESATALAANGGNCSSGTYPLGVDTLGAVENCTADDDTPDDDSEVPDSLTITSGTIDLESITLTGAENDYMLMGTGSGGATWITVPNCVDGTEALDFAGSSWVCQTLSLTATTLDLGDDDIVDSPGVTEIATSGDTNSIFTESATDKLLIDLSKDWPKADDADDVTCTGCVSDAELASTFTVPADFDTEAEFEAIVTDTTNFIVSTEIDTEAELEAIVAGLNFIIVTEIDSEAELSAITGLGANIIDSTEIDEIAELDILVADANILTEAEIDASAELWALMDDKTGTAGLLVFSTAPTLNGLTTISTDDASETSTVDILTVTHSTSGTAGNGIGAGLTFNVEDNGNIEQQGSIDVVLDDVSNAAEYAAMLFSLNQNGEITEIMQIGGSTGAYVGIGNTAPATILHTQDATGPTFQVDTGNPTDTALTLYHQDTGTPANNDGIILDFAVETSIQQRTLGQISVTAPVITDASRTGDMHFLLSNGGNPAEKLTLTAAGLLGINDQSPDGSLDIEGTAATDVALIVAGASSQTADAVQIDSNGDGTYNEIVAPASGGLDFSGTTLLKSRALVVDTGGVFDINMGTSSGDDFTIDTSAFVVEGDTGNVGIGTTSPNFPLTIGAAGAALRIQPSNAANAYMYLRHGTVANNSIIKSDSAQGLGFGTNATEDYLYINSSGRVGIGTTSPTQLMHLYEPATSALLKIDSLTGGHAGILFAAANTQGAYIDFGDHDDADVGEIFYYHVDDSLRFTVNAAERVRIASTGNVGIGTTSPDGTLHVHTATAGSATASVSADELTLENSGNVGMTFLSPNTATASIYFADPESTLAGLIDYNHSTNLLRLGTSATVRANIGTGLYMTGATGGAKGAGTINATAVYDDNVLLTDFVFESGYNMLSIPEMRAYYEKHLHLPTIPGRETWEKEGSFSVGKISSHIWETVEVQAIYIAELEERLSRLEAKFQ